MKRETIVIIASLLIAFIVLLFGDNIYEQFTGHSVLEAFRPTREYQAFSDPNHACIVPQIEGLDQIAAELALSQLGLRIARATMYDATIPSGAVISQDPPSNTRLSPCQGEVVIVISLGSTPTPAQPTKIFSPTKIPSQTHLSATKAATPNPRATIVFEDDFFEDPNSSGKWTIYRFSNDLAHEAAWDSTNKIVYLTKAINWKGAAMYANYNLTAKNWEAEFRYKAGAGADGFTFFFYKDSSPQELYAGGNLGFKTIPESGYAVEFDTFAGTGDPSAYHIALLEKSTSNHLQSTNDSRTKDNAWHRVVIRFLDGHILVTVDGNFVIDHTIESVDYTFAGVGVSASTGNVNNDFIIDDFSIKLLPNS